ncbi:MAG: heme exporter protein CcmD [Rhodobacterales bacterium]|nr:heme exporter protein CcmD [Puniceibacterium antarcticum]
MMPDLGKYAGAVLSSYAVALGLIVVLVALSIWRARRVKAALDLVEKRNKRHG